MAKEDLSSAPSTTYRVQWWAKNADGVVHTNHHDHTDEVVATADFMSCNDIAHIVTATLTKIEVTSTVRQTFTRENNEVGAAGSFTDQSAA